MQINHDEVGALQALLQSAEHLRLKRNSLEHRIRDLQEQLRNVRHQEILIENEIHSVRIRNSKLPIPTIRPPSARNIGILRVWGALSDALSKATDPRGLTTNEAKQVIRQSLPGIPENTVRSHLHRLKKKGFIEQHGTYWRLHDKQVLESDAKLRA